MAGDRGLEDVQEEEAAEEEAEQEAAEQEAAGQGQKLLEPHRLDLGLCWGLCRRCLGHSGWGAARLAPNPVLQGGRRGRREAQWWNSDTGTCISFFLLFVCQKKIVTGIDCYLQGSFRTAGSRGGCVLHGVR